jgi:lipopolysaccharide heptosyltransferase II
MIDKKRVKKILIIKLRGIGDVLLSTVIVKNLLDEFPDAKIDYLTEKPGKLALSSINEINEILLLERKSALQKIKLIMEIRKRDYDLIFDFFSNPTTALITFFSRAKYRVGFPYRGRKYAYNLFGPEERGKYHSADLHLETLKAVGIEVTSNDQLFSFSNEEKMFADEFFAENDLRGKAVVGICPSGGWDSKKCTPNKFAEFARAIHNKYNVELLILWGPGDLKDATEIKRRLPETSIFMPATSIKQMASVISHCTVLIANDSGPMHISATVGTPTIALFGPTDPKLQGPYGNKHEIVRLDALDCINCNLTECPKNKECFTNIAPEMVLGKFDNIILKNKLNIAVRNG